MSRLLAVPLVGRSARYCAFDGDILQANPPKGNWHCVRETAQRCVVEGTGILHCQNDERSYNQAGRTITGNSSLSGAVT